MTDNNSLPLDQQTFGLSLDPEDPEVLKLHVQWDKMLSDLLDEEYMNLSFAFNLGDLIGIFGGSVGSGWDWANELFSAGADISWDAFVNMAVEVGIDFGDIMSGDVDFFLYDYDDHGHPGDQRRHRDPRDDRSESRRHQSRS